MPSEPAKRLTAEELDIVELTYLLDTEARSVRIDTDRLRILIATARREARYEKALIRLRDCDWVISRGDRMDAVRDIARAALQEPPHAS